MRDGQGRFGVPVFYVVVAPGIGSEELDDQEDDEGEGDEEHGEAGEDAGVVGGVGDLGEGGLGGLEEVADGLGEVALGAADQGRWEIGLGVGWLALQLVLTGQARLAGGEEVAILLWGVGHGFACRSGVSFRRNLLRLRVSRAPGSFHTSLFIRQHVQIL